MEYALTIFIFMGVIAVTAMVFGIWIFVTVIRFIVRGVGMVLAPPKLPPMPLAIGGRRCRNEQCRAVNPGNARFCRRCGTELPEAQRVHARRAALW